MPRCRGAAGEPQLAGCRTRMPTLIEHIPRDIWHYLSKTFLLPEEVSALSSSCRRFRSDFMPILFREVVITAVHDPEYATYIDFLANLLRIEKRIRYFAQNTNICAAICVVELRQCRPVWWLQLRNRCRTRTAAQSKGLQNFIHSEYLRIYSEVVGLVNTLPNLRLVYLRETDFTRLPFYNPSRNYAQRFHEHSASENLLELAVDAHSSAERLPVSVIFTSFQDGETGDLDLNSPFRNEVSQIRQYFKDVLQGSSMTLIGGRFSESVLPAVLPNLFQRYTSLARVELELTPTLATENMSSIYELLPQMAALIHLGIRFPSNQAERFTTASRGLSRLSSFKGPCVLLPHHLKTYCPTTACVGDSLSILQHIPLACRESLRLLDLSSSARVTSTFLNVAPDIWPNIEELWLFSARVSRGQAPHPNFVSLFKELVPFNNLRFVVIVVYPSNVEAAEASTDLLSSRPAPLLQEIIFEGVATYTWTIEYGWVRKESPLELSPPFSEDERKEALSIVNRYGGEQVG